MRQASGTPCWQMASTYRGRGVDNGEACAARGRQGPMTGTCRQLAARCQPGGARKPITAQYASFKNPWRPDEIMSSIRQALDQLANYRRRPACDDTQHAAPPCIIT